MNGLCVNKERLTVNSSTVVLFSNKGIISGVFIRLNSTKSHP